MEHLILLLTLTGAVIGAEHNAFTVPDSLRNPTACNAKKRGFVCDPDGLLIDSSKKTDGSTLLNNAIENVRATDVCPCSDCLLFSGTAISVVVVQKIKMAFNETSREIILKAMKKFANDIRTRQARGLCDDDILIAVSIDDNEVQTSYGQRLNIRLNDTIVKEIANIAKQDFDKRNWTNGLLSMINNYGSILRNGTLAVRRSGTHWYSPLPLCVVICGAVLIAAIVAALVIGLISCRNGRRYSAVI
uniref:Ground-like domain-containing protein n=1 Tax=Syphacia muris TaxID=451379 RepID=A0A0N5AA99_9BILA